MKNFKIKAFGIIAEKLPRSEFEFPYRENSEILVEALKMEYPDLRPLYFSLAVNKQIVQANTGLNGNEEIALLPPFSGG